MKRSEVHVPSKFTGISAEAYVDGYLAGYTDQSINATMMSFLAESTIELVKHGTSGLTTEKGAKAIYGRVAKKLGRHAAMAERIATAARAVRDIGRK